MDFFWAAFLNECSIVCWLCDGQDSESSHDSFFVEEEDIEEKFSESDNNRSDEDATLLADDNSQQGEDEETQIISESEEEIEDSENESSNSENESSESEQGSDGGEEGQKQESDSEERALPSVAFEKKKPLSNAQIAELNNKIKKTGVVYLSSIPPGMNWSQVMQHLKVFGEINRSHLRKEDASASQRRKGHVNFTEGWVEFVNRKDAKMCVSQLNGRIVGGKKSGKFHDYIWTMKYLHGFKWPQLLELMNYEKRLRADKLKSEFSKLKKQDEKYLENVSKSESMKRKREKGEEISAKKQNTYRVCNKDDSTTFAHLH